MSGTKAVCIGILYAVLLVLAWIGVTVVGGMIAVILGSFLLGLTLGIGVVLWCIFKAKKSTP